MRTTKGNQQDPLGRLGQVICKFNEDLLRTLECMRVEGQSQPRGASSMKLDEFSNQYLAYAINIFTPGTIELHKLSLAELHRFVGNIPLSEITPYHLDQLKANLVNRMAPVTCNIRIKKLRAIFNVALKWRLMEENPANAIDLVRENEPSPDFFTQNDFQRLLAVIRERWLRDLVTFAGSTGLRRAELVHLRWEDIDMERRLVLVRCSEGFRTKAGKRRTVPLNDTAFYIVRGRIGVDGTGLVFSNNGKKLNEDWISSKLKSYVRELGLNPKLHFHSLRHSFATWLVQSGVSIYEVKELMGHTSLQVTEVYSHLATSELHGSVAKIKLPGLN